MLEPQDSVTDTAAFLLRMIEELNSDEELLRENGNVNLMFTATAFADRKQPLIALHYLRAFSRVLENLEVRAVLAARSDGASWPAIGRALGISHQAARQRYGAAEETVIRLSDRR